MPAMSKKQFRFMAAIAHGGKLKKKAPGLSKEKAKEYISHNKGSMSYGKLPEASADSKKKRKFKVFGKKS